MKTRVVWFHVVAVVLLVYCQEHSARAEANLVAHWEFEEDSGTTIYDSAGHNNGTIYGNPIRETGRLGKGLHLDGFDDYVEVPDNICLRPEHITISVWIKLDTFNQSVMVVGKSNYADAYNEQYALNIRADATVSHRAGMNIKRESGGQPSIGWYRVHSVTELETNTWYLLTGTWDGTTLRIYVNGVLEAENIDVPPGPIDDCPGGTLKIGCWWNGHEERLNGSIDDVRVYDGALSDTDIAELYAQAPTDYYVDAGGSDANTGQSPRAAFATIQKGVDAARDGDIVWIGPGVYTGEIRLQGKAITIAGLRDAPILQNPAGPAVSFTYYEGSSSVLKNVVIRDSQTGILIISGSPTIKNATIVGNDIGIECYDGQPDVSNCILWNNIQADLLGCQARYSCLQSGTPGLGNISDDPLFLDPNAGDYHLCSERGVYWSRFHVWILGDVTSPCLDSGDPSDVFGTERVPNGGRINMGAYGGTSFASMSEMPPSADLNGDGVVDQADLTLYLDLWDEQTQDPLPVRDVYR